MVVSQVETANEIAGKVLELVQKTIQYYELKHGKKYEDSKVPEPVKEEVKKEEPKKEVKKEESKKQEPTPKKEEKKEVSLASKPKPVEKSLAPAEKPIAATTKETPKKESE